jgi:hypothetical protein
VEVVIVLGLRSFPKDPLTNNIIIIYECSEIRKIRTRRLKLSLPEPTVCPPVPTTLKSPLLPLMQVTMGFRPFRAVI